MAHAALLFASEYLLQPPLALHLPPLQPPPSACTPPVDAICDTTGIEKATSKPGLGAFK